MTKKELSERVKEQLPKATVAQYRWIYAYLNDLEEWPIITDSLPVPRVVEESD